MTARLGKKVLVAKNTWLFEFGLSQSVDYEPGQSFRLTLAGAGHRFFSIANAPNPKFVITVTREGKSLFKRALLRLEIGDRVDVSSIGGVFTLPERQNRKLVFIAGGIGITPFVSLIKVGLSPRYARAITLLYSNPDKESCAFLNELQELEQTNDRFRLVTVFTRQGSARIDAKFFRKSLEKTEGNLYYVAGPVQMVNELFEELLKFGASPDAIKTEEFTGY